MAAARRSLRFTVYLVPLVLAAACGGASPDVSLDTAADAKSDGPGAGQKPRGDGELDSLETLRDRLKKPSDKKELDLAAKGWGAELGRVLGDAEGLTGVEKLDVSDNDLGPEGARGLLASSHLGALAELDLGGNEIGDDGAKALAAGRLEKLTTLNLSGNGIGPDGGKAPPHGTRYPALISLDL